MSTITLLGVGCGVPDADRDFTSLVWHGSGRPLLIDAGGSPYVKLLRAGIEPVELGGVLLTHSHCDHISGLPALLFSMWLAGRRNPEDPLPVYGLEPTLKIAQRVVDAFELEGIAAPVVWKPFAAGDTLPLPAGAEAFRLSTAPTMHSRPCVALRFEERTTGEAVAYSCDTAPCPAVEELAQGARVLIHEATTPGPFASHTSPRQAGEVAARAGVGSLVLVHYSPRWTMSEADACAEAQAGGFTGPVEVGRELQNISVFAKSGDSCEKTI